MRATKTTDSPQKYEIRLQGCLDQRWADWFANLAFIYEPEGTTLLVGTLADQAALHGVFSKIRDLGVPILSVQAISQSHKE